MQPHKSWAQLMSAGLAGLRAEDPAALPTIIYASRTHSQLKQVMGELESTGYKCALIPLRSLRGPLLLGAFQAGMRVMLQQLCRLMHALHGVFF